MRTHSFAQRARRALLLAAAGGILAGCGGAADASSGTQGTSLAQQAAGVGGGPSRPLPHQNPHIHLSAIHSRRHHRVHQQTPPPPTSPASSSTSVPPTTNPPPAILSGGVTAIGDSVMVDFEPCLQADIKNINFDAFVGQQWYQGIADVQTLRAEGQLGSVVIIALGTNGPIDSQLFDEMMQALHGVSRVIFVTNYVNESWTDWQNSNNAVLWSGVSRYPNAVIADWYSLAVANPQWFVPNGGPHVAIGGAAAAAAAALIASKI
jgi:hypothetical protein